MSGYVTPKYLEERFSCPKCGAFAHQHWSELKVEVKSGQYKSFALFADGVGVFFVVNETLRVSHEVSEGWRASTCTSCTASAVWRGAAMVFPADSSAPAHHPDMPEDVAQLYDEARAVLPASPRASAALARATLERLLRRLDSAPKGKRLDDLIASLSGKVGAPLWQLLTALRVVGNDSLHGSGEEELVILLLDGDAGDLAVPLFGAINSVVEELITQPKKAQALYNMIPQAKREQAEAKARTDKPD